MHWEGQSAACQRPLETTLALRTCYFTIEAKGQMYERMLQAQSISIYVPAGMNDLKLELVAVTS